MGATRAEPIAIIGYGCRLPGAEGPRAFSALLREGRDAVGEVPASRWEAARYYDPARHTAGKSVSRWGGFLEGIEEFDAAFFGIVPREAARMDPVQRLLLEVTWEGLEDAGLPAEALAGSETGVFIGAIGHDFALLCERAVEQIDGHTPLGTLGCIAANRLSYVFDLRGPSLTVDCACSSSLMAVHLACRSLEDGECQLAIAGGANVLLAPEPGIAFSHAGALSPTGRCRSFTAAADGYVRSEGAGVVILKPLARALADGDRVRAVIRATGCNQDGRTNGISAPSGPAQEALLRRTWVRAGIDPAAVAFVEAQGSGTPLGDAMEARAIGAVAAQGRPPDRPCYLGAVKTNLGHLELASGIASLLKTVLSVEERVIFRNLHAGPLNSAVPWDELRLRIPAETTRWPDGPAVAGVTTLGLGGTNVHAVIEAAPELPPRAVSPSTEARLLPLSARSPEALRALAAAWLPFLDGLLPESLADAAFTAALRRSHHAHRLALVFRSRDELHGRLQAFLEGAAPVGWAAGRRPGVPRRKLAFLLCGTRPVLDETLRAAAPARGALAAFEEAARALALPLDDAPAQALGQRLALASILRARGVVAAEALGPGAVALRPAGGPGALAEALQPGSGPLTTEALFDLVDRGFEQFIVLGGNSPDVEALATALRAKRPTALLVPALREGEPPHVALLEALAALYAAGLTLRFDGLYGESPQIVDLPHHPWLRRRLWLGSVGAGPPPPAAQAPAAPSQQPPSATLLDRLAAAPPEARHGLLLAELCSDLAHALGLDRAAIEPERSFLDLGVDSILAAEMISRFEGRLGHPLVGPALLSHPNLDAVAQALVTALFPAAKPPGGPPSSEDAELAGLIGDLERLTDSEVAALLAADSAGGRR